MSQASQILSLPIPANSTVPVSGGGGNYFYLVSSVVPVNIRPEGGNFISYRQGKGQFIAGGFTRLEVQNFTNTAVTIQLYVGYQPQVTDVKLIELPPTFLSTDTRLINNATQQVYSGLLTLANFGGTTGILYRRKSVTFTLTTLAATLIINGSYSIFSGGATIINGYTLGAGGDPINSAQTAAQVTIETDDTITVNCSAGGPATYRIAQLWYQAQ